MFTGELIGFIAGAITTGSFIPQVIRVLKLKSAREISMLFASLLLFGCLLWVAYGIYLSLIPLVLWNSVMIVLTSLLLYAKLKYGK